MVNESPIVRTPDDVLVEIAMNLYDISNVLALSMVCKRFQAISRLRRIWIDLVTEITDRFLDFFTRPNFEEMSYDELYNLAKHAVTGPCCHHESDRFPPPAHQITFPLKRDILEDIHDPPPNVFVLPGGQFMIVSSRGDLVFKSLVVGKDIWVYETLTGCPYNRRIVKFSVYITKPNREFLIGIWIDYDYTYRSLIEVVSVDLSTGRGASLCGKFIPKIGRSCLSISISHDFVIASGFKVLLVLHISTWILGIYHMDFDGFPHTDVVSDHVACLYRSSDGSTVTLSIWDPQTLLAHSTEPNHDRPSLPNNMPKPLASCSVSAFAEKIQVFSCYLSPIQKDISRACVLMDQATDNFCHFLRFSISHPNGRPESIILQSNFKLFQRTKVKYIPYNGLVGVNKHRGICHLSVAHGVVKCYNDPLHALCMTPYSGTISYSTLDDIVIAYYD
ncbi:hypothetical protein E4T56_gene11626 [Termitomyces sp. T112]|nr:hypothetical protein E4T56_gene11626 [Termitomyces sp. T112]